MQRVGVNGLGKMGGCREVQDLVLGPNGLLEGTQPGSIIVISSTVRPRTVKHLAESAALRGVHVLDEPLCRGGRCGRGRGGAGSVPAGAVGVLQRY